MKHSRALNTILFALFLLLGFLAYREFLQVNILAYVNQQNIWDSRRFITFLAFCALSLFGSHSVHTRSPVQSPSQVTDPHFQESFFDIAA